MPILTLRSIVLILIIGLTATLGTLLIERSVPSEKIKHEYVWFGAPWPFLAEDFSSMDPPPGVTLTIGLSPLEKPLVDGNFVNFLANLALFTLPLLPIAIGGEALLYFRKRRKA